MELNKIICGDTLTELKKFPDECVDMVMTSPPYWALRDYGVEGQLGLEPTFQEYITKLCDIFDEIKRVLKKEGTCWVNLGDTYGGSGAGTWQNKPLEAKSKEVYTMPYGKSSVSKMRGTPQDKCLLQIPSRFAIEMTNRGWILRNEIIWHKPNCMPSSVKDRFTVDFEKLFFFSKSKKYWFETQLEKSYWADFDKRADIKGGKKSGGKTATGMYATNKVAYTEGGMRNKRAVWKITTKPYSEAHFAVYPEKLCVTPIKAGCPEKGTVLDCFFGSGTTGLVAQKLNRNYIGIELNEDYIKIAEKRLAQKTML